MSTALIAEISNALNHHELLKVKIRADSREERDTAVASLVAKTGALLVSRIGNVAVLYRPNPDGPRLALAQAGRGLAG